MVSNIKVTCHVQPESYYYYNYGCSKAALLKNKYRPPLHHLPVNTHMRINMMMLPTDILVLKTTMEKHCGSEHNNGKGHVFVCVCKSGHRTGSIQVCRPIQLAFN